METEDINDTNKKIHEITENVDKTENIANPSNTSELIEDNLVEIKEDVQLKQLETSKPDSENNSSVVSQEVKENVDIVSTDIPTNDVDNNPSQEENVDSSLKPLEYDPKNVHYEGDIAIYTDPASGCKYKWNQDKNEWENFSELVYGFEDDTHTYMDTDGVKLFWDKEKKAWFPKIDDEFMAQYQLNYGFVDNTNIEVKAPPPIVKKPVKPPVEQGVKRKPSEPSWFEMDDLQTTKVYVNNLPLDTTEETFSELMQKCGIIMRDPSSGNLKIKLYTEPGSKELKGDALCTYIKVESVDLALKLLDGYNFNGKKITVERAKFQLKGDYNPKLKPKTKKRKEKDKLKKMQEKLFTWKPEKFIGDRAKHERIVVVKNVFEPKMFDEDVGLILELQEDLREECSKCGEVKKVIIYDRHPEGVAQINMKEAEDADACVKMLHGRWFGKRQLVSETWDGKTKFKIAETDSEISQRIDKWDQFLETGDDKGDSHIKTD